MIIELIKKQIRKTIEKRNGVLIFYRDPNHLELFELLKTIKNETELLLQDNESYQIFMAVKNTIKVPGDIAEVGCYKGGSSKIICEAKGNKKFYTFDTFEGLPELDKVDIKYFEKGMYLASFEEVKNYLKDYPNVYVYKGIFPSNADSIKDKRFSFVHLDLDLYKATKESLEFFYPRMNKGGVIISHDYLYAKGVRKAFDDFFKNKSEPIIEMSGTQCLIVKT